MKYSIILFNFLIFFIFNNIQSSSLFSNIEVTNIKKSSLKISLPLFSYVRCYYNNDNNSLDIRSSDLSNSYEWAEESDGSFFTLTGKWFATIENISYVYVPKFFTSKLHSDVQKTCDDTIKKKHGINSFSFQQYAALDRFSVNHTIWYQDENPNNTPFNNIIVFGDSLSDTGNLYNLSLGEIPKTNSYFLGHFSNRLNYTEYLAQLLKLNVYSWAIGGAQGNTRFFFLGGISSQVDLWQQEYKQAIEYDTKKSLYIVWIGSNDINNGTRTLDQIFSDETNAINTLINSGAKYIIVITVPPIGLTPLRNNDPSKNSYNQLALKYNDMLNNYVNSLKNQNPDLNLMLFDAYNELMNAIQSASSYNITNVTDSCLFIDQNFNKLDWATFYFISHTVSDTCKQDESKFLWHDILHPTAAIYQILANKLYQNMLDNNWLVSNK